GPVRTVQDRGGRRLVDLAALDPDQAILDVVDPPDTVRAAQVVDTLDEVDRSEPLAIDRDGDAALEVDDDLDRRRGIGRGHGPLVRIRRRGDPRILEDAGLT